MVDFATLKIDIDSSGAKEGTQDVENLTEAGEDAESGIGKATKGISSSFKKLTAIAGLTLGAAGVVGFIKDMSREAILLETNLLRIDAVIAATGGTALKTTEGLLKSARDLARVTLESTEGVMQAQATLLTFRAIQGDVYDRALSSAADLAAVLGGNIQTTVLQLAKALESPVEGLSALSRSGTVFTKVQKDMVRQMVETNRLGEAQSFILDELEAQYGGVAIAVAGGLAGSYDSLSQAWQELKLGMADNIVLLDRTGVVVDKLTEFLVILTRDVDDTVVALTGMAGIGVTLAASVFMGPLGVALTGLASIMAVVAMHTNDMEAATLTAIKAEEALTVALGGVSTGSQTAIGRAEDMVTARRDQAKAALVAAEAELALMSAQAQGNLWNAIWSDKEMTAAENTIATLRQTISEANTELDNLWAEGQAAVGTFTGVQIYVDAVDDLRRSLDPSIETNEEYVKSMDMIYEALKIGAINTAEYNVLFDGLIEKYHDAEEASEGVASGVKAVDKAVDEMATEIDGHVMGAVDGLVNAFTDFLRGGLKDFRGFAQSVLNVFTDLLIQMIAMAARNKIMISLGMGGGTTGGIASGLMGTALGGIGTAATAGVAATAGSGLLGGLGASLGIGAASGGAGAGILGVGANAALAGGGIMATIGAALPIIGIGIALFSLFKKKPVMKAEDFNAIQSGLGLVNQSLFDTSRAGQEMAKSLMDVSGGIEDFTSETQAYYDLFFSEEEKRAAAAEVINEAFVQMGVAAPESKEAFRSMVEGLDLTTEAGQEAFATMMDLAPTFSALAEEGSKANDALRKLLNPTYGIFATLQDQVFATSRPAESLVSRTKSDTVEALEGIKSVIRDGNIAIAKNTGKTAQLFERLTLDPEGGLLA